MFKHFSFFIVMHDYLAYCRTIEDGARMRCKPTAKSVDALVSSSRTVPLQAGQIRRQNLLAGAKVFLNINHNSCLKFSFQFFNFKQMLCGRLDIASKSLVRILYMLSKTFCT